MKTKYVDYSTLIVAILGIVFCFSLVSFLPAPNLASLFLIVPGCYSLIAAGYFVLEVLLISWIKKDKITNGRKLAITIIKIVLLVLFLFRGGILEYPHLSVSFFTSLLFLITMVFDLMVFTYDLISNDKEKESNGTISIVAFSVISSLIMASMLSIALYDYFSATSNNIFLVIVCAVFIVISLGQIFSFIFNKKYYLANGLIVLFKTSFLLLYTFSFSFLQTLAVCFGTLHSFLLIGFFALMLIETVISWIYFLKSIKVVRQSFKQEIAS